MAVDLKNVPAIVEEILQLEDVPADEVSINFVDVPLISKLHQEYFDDPTPTDCITFPIDPEGTEYRVLGEVFACPKIALLYAEEHALAPYDELLLYLVHGLLHLCGYRDDTDEECKKIRAAETRAMNHLKKQALTLQPKQ